MPRAPASFDLPDAAATHALAREMAGRVRASDMIALSGPIGAGKTEFCRALIRARAGAEIDVPSPTFTIIQTYDLPDIRIAHLDLYRLADPSEIAELGIDDIAGDHLLLVEWAERAEGALPPPTAHLEFEVRGDARTVRFTDRIGRFDGIGALHA